MPVCFALSTGLKLAKYSLPDIFIGALAAATSAFHFASSAKCVRTNRGSSGRGVNGMFDLGVQPAAISTNSASSGNWRGCFIDLGVITATFTGPRRTSLVPKAARPAAPCATYCYSAISGRCVSDRAILYLVFLFAFLQLSTTLFVSCTLGKSKCVRILRVLFRCRED